MKVAICFSGQARMFKTAYPFMYERVIVPVQADVFIHTWKNEQPIIETHGGWRYADEGSIGEFIDLYKPILCEIERYDTQFEKILYNPKFESRKTPKASVLRYMTMLYKVYCCNQLVKKWENLHNFHYDLIIRTRSDAKPLSTINLEQIKDALENNVFYSDVVRPGLISDILCFSNSANMDIYCNLFKEIDKYYDLGVTFDPELMPEFYMNHNKIVCKGSNIGWEIPRPPTFNP